MGKNCFTAYTFEEIIKNMHRRLLYIITVFLISGCGENNQSTFTKEEKQAVTDSVRKTLHNYYADINSSGLHAEFAYLDSSDDFFWVPPGYTSAIEYDSVAALIRHTAPAFRQVNNTWDSLRITPLSTEFASYYGKLHSIMTDTAGKMEDFFLIETGLLIKRKDGWKLFQGQTAILP
jgi:hypothetical protein